jgi:hypothetical protein
VARAITRVEISKKKRKAFLVLLAETGNVKESALAVGYKSTDMLHRMRRQDKQFAAEWDIAVNAAGDLLEAEAFRRAHDGVLEPDYFKGEVVGYTRKYSDTLLALLLKKVRPEYRDNSGNGGVNVKVGVAIMPSAAKDPVKWEEKAVLMHDEQETLTVEPVEDENHLLAAKAAVVRGD